MMRPSRISRQRGFNLIEMMVGITIGLLGLMAVTTIFIKFNQKKTVETSLMESQSNGAMALFLLERDIDRAGYGFMGMQNCTCNYVDNGNTAQARTSTYCEKWPTDVLVNPHTVDPIRIKDGGALSDSLFIQYGTPSGGLVLTSILAKQINFADDFQLQSTAGIAKNDILVLNRGGSCAAYQATAVSESLKTISHEALSTTLNPSAQPAIGYDTALPNDQLINLGHYVSKNLHVDEGNAQLLENTSPTYGNDTPIVDNIVYMKAELGIDTNGDKLVNSWSKPAVGAIADYGTVLAVRIGIVARSQAKDTDSPTPNTLVVLPAITGGNEQDYAVPDKKYRYKVYYTIIPLRNMIWH